MYCGKCGRANRDGISYCIHCGAELATQRPKESLDETFSAEPTRIAQQIPQSPPVTIGSLIADRYEVQELLGRGGMASIYKVLDHELRHEAALKLMAEELARDTSALERFRNEARLARLLIHPHIVRTYDIGSWGSRRFLTMQYVQGTDLRRTLDERGALPFDEARRIALELLDALQYAHRHTIHRDLKPANVLLDGEQRAVRLTDFGIARVAPEFTFHTRTGIALGTSRYMAPEQWRDAATVDARADLYAFGVLLYEMTTGRLPEGRFKLPSELQGHLPPELDTLVERCLAQDPEDRPRDAGTVREELLRLAAAPSLPRRPIAVAMKEPARPSPARPVPEVSSPAPVDDDVLRDVEATIAFRGIWLARDRTIQARLDGHPVGGGSLVEGFELRSPTSRGDHVLELVIDDDVRQTIPLRFALPGPHRVELEWIRATARFSKTHRLIEPPPFA
ncbi:MAG: protein kinase [Planctomycetes bacterium]|nr:protein kinase [Planctomycetota bacterium]